GASTNEGLGCPWGCYALFTCKKLKADFGTPVFLILDREILREDLRKVKTPWVRIGKMGEPLHNIELAIEVCKVAREMGKIPVVITPMWDIPSLGQLAEFARFGVIIHASIYALDLTVIPIDIPTSLTDGHSLGSCLYHLGISPIQHYPRRCLTSIFMLGLRTYG
ncbi:MAG: hypothetical protein ACXABY_11705, partial [Candidatus Thorarchaeota archaeon]